MKHLIALALIYFCTSCSLSYKEHTQEIYHKMISKKIYLPDIEPYSIGNINENFKFHNRYKIVMYVDSNGCIGCKLQLPVWNNLISEMDSLTKNRVDVIIYTYPRNKEEMQFILRRDKFNHPIYLDMEDIFNKTNNLPDDNRFRCFLLDEDNRVILIGNPINNPKIKELYIRTICERLGIESPTSNEESLRLENSLGVFDWHVEQQTSFVINNQNDDIMHIDSLYTSCECTTASIDLTDIEPRGKAIVNVIFKADRPEQFMREIYADVRGGKQIIMTINGEATE